MTRNPLGGKLQQQQQLPCLLSREARWMKY